MRFNPRPREGATGGLEQFRQVFHVSIHAPVKGRPDELMAVYRGETVSIHAPVKGRLKNFGEYVSAAAVSIHAPVKGRPKSWPRLRSQRRVSIHAPVKGRRGGNLRQGLVRGFNPRPREGATARP